MKTVKLYQWKGTGSLSLLFNIDGKKQEVVFPTGSEKPKVNARLETSDAIIQGKIENTHLFKLGQIKLLSTKQIAEPGDEVSDSQAQKPPVKSATKPVAKPVVKPEVKVDPNVFSAVTNYQQAAAVLVEKFSADDSQLQDPEAIMAKANEVGATFPNLIE